MAYSQLSISKGQCGISYGCRIDMFVKEPIILSLYENFLSRKFKN